MPHRKWRNNATVEKLAVLFVFSVIVTLVPFIVTLLYSIGYHQFTFSLILGDGQLLLVGVAISAAAFGELVAVDLPEGQRIFKILAIGSCTLIITISSLWFGEISAAPKGAKPPDPKIIILGSAIIYSWTLASSAWCLALSTKGASTARPLLREIQEDKEK